MTQVVVIGGSAAGLKAACRTARILPDAKVTVLVQDRHFACSACGLPYFLSGDVSDIRALFSTSYEQTKDVEYFRAVKGVEILVSHRATGRDPVVRSGVYRWITAGAGDRQNPTCRSYRSRLHRSGDVRGVAGSLNVDVVLIEAAPYILSGVVDQEISLLIEQNLTGRGVGLHMNGKVSGIESLEGRLRLKGSNMSEALFDRIILATGAVSDSRLAVKTGLKTDIWGSIAVNRFLQTSDPHIFAAGDCAALVESLAREQRPRLLAVRATLMGRLAADNLAGRGIEFQEPNGAAILKLFELTVGAIGKSQQECEREGIETLCSWGTFHDRMDYYPEASYISFKLICEKSTGRMIGLQGIGSGRLQNLLDKATLLINRGCNYRDLGLLEHSYAPPFSQPVDPLTLLGTLLENSAAQQIEILSPARLMEIIETSLILDVRSPMEIERFPLPPDLPSVSIPLMELRDRLDEIGGDGRHIVAVCQMGARSYEAAVILRHAGRSQVGMLAGGMLFQPLIGSRAK